MRGARRRSRPGVEQRKKVGERQALIGARAHLHSADNGEEIVTPQTIAMYGLQTAAHSVPRPSGIEERDFALLYG
jgi:hypothetical protein